MNRKSRWWLLPMLALASMSGWCLVPVKATLSALVSRADIVVIVRDVENLPFRQDEGERYFRISATTVTALKGEMPKDTPLTIRVDRTIPDYSPRCCKDDTSYLIFLVHARNGELTPIGVVNSVVEIGQLK